MNFDKTVNSLLEDFKEIAQDVNTGYSIGMKQLVHNITNDPRGTVVALLDLIRRSPGMYADLLSGKMEQLSQKFKELGVDFGRITDQVAQARELAIKEQAGKKIPVRRAIAIPKQKSRR